MEQKYIFLDFDGVLHHESGYNLFANMDNFLLLLKLTKTYFNCNIRLIFSTSWRYSYPLEKLIELLKEHSNNQIIDYVFEYDITPYDVFKSSYNRYSEVMEYIKNHNIDISDCLILDDILELFKEALSPNYQDKLADDKDEHRDKTFIKQLYITDGTGLSKDDALLAFGKLI